MNYFRVTYRSGNHAYQEDIDIGQVFDSSSKTLELLTKRCKREGAILSKDSAVKGLLETLEQSDYCPLIFREEPIITIHVEYRTTTEI